MQKSEVRNQKAECQNAEVRIIRSRTPCILHSDFYFLILTSNFFILHSDF